MLHWEILRWAGRGIFVAWLLWGVVWLIMALRTKPVLRYETVGSRAGYILPILASMVLLLLAKRTHLGAALLAAGPPVSWLFARFIAFYPGVVWVGAPLVLVGTLFAFWARFRLAGNWSASVALKQGHELVVAGPYRLVRHPIYTGALLTVAGTACAIGQWRGVLALALTFCGFCYKIHLEERLMLATFGDAYRRYRSQVKRLIPFVL
jgi:protein-S-isoprenylcysteine O-methyltransferase Ste14